MKKKSKYFIAFLAFVIIVSFVLMIPAASEQVSKWTNIAADKIRNGAATVAGAGIGIMLISFGVAALSVPIVGIALIVIGLAILAYSVWPLFSKSNGMSATYGKGLQKIM